MSELGQFLEVVCGPDERFATLRATIRQWADEKLAATADSPNHTVFGRRKSSQSVDTSTGETILKVWIRTPDSVRIETTRVTQDDPETTLTVVAGEKWWCRDDEGHVESHEGSTRQCAPAITDIERHFDGEMLRNFLGGLSLEQTGTLDVAGRMCAQVRATNRPTGQIWPHWLPSNADEYEFHTDPARGILLGILALSKGKPFEGSQVQDISFDEPLDDELFTYVPELGEQVHPSVPVVEHVSLDAAIARMPFTVLVPNPLPDADHTHLEMMFHPARKKSPRAFLTLSFHGSDRFHHTWIHESDSPETDHDSYEWTCVHHCGLELLLSDPQIADAYRVLSFQHEGTHVKIFSKLSPPVLFDLAASMSTAESGR